MGALEAVRGDTWFRLGDRDLATHLHRGGRLRDGVSLSAVTAELAAAMGIAHTVLPMSDAPVSTVVHSDEGEFPFQHYFVRRQCEPAVSGFHFEGLADAAPNRALMSLLENEGVLDLIVLCPSNPFVSIDPILSLSGVAQALRQSSAPLVAVCPIVAGMAIKGPTAKMMAELGMPTTALAVAEHYAAEYPGLIDTMVIDDSDSSLKEAITDTGMGVATAPTIMRNLDDKIALARACLELTG